MANPTELKSCWKEAGGGINHRFSVSKVSCGEAMGRLIPSEEKYKLHVNSHALKRILKWVAVVVTLFTVLTCDKAGVRLWDCVTRGNQVAAELLLI